MTDQRTLIREARAAWEQAATSADIPPRVVVGLDGFIDEIVHVVDKRHSFDRYDRVPTIAAYAARLAKAAGKSTNVELVLRQVKMGGNGPLLSDAFGRLDARVVTCGALGVPTLHPVFERLQDYGPVLSLTEPAVTIAAEFDDGKIMHGKLDSLNAVTFDNWLRASGGRDALRQTLAGADLLALVNWTMIPHMTAVWKELLPLVGELGTDAPRHVFFDLCDPQKRSREDLAEAIATMARFADTGSTAILGLNEKESSEVCEAIGIPEGGASPEELLDRARRLRATTGIAEIVIHPRTFAVAASEAGEGSVAGPVCENPKLTTGAGDSFNGGYCMARMLGLPPTTALVAGKAVSGYYVRAGHGPSRSELLRFLDRWEAGTLDPW